MNQKKARRALKFFNIKNVVNLSKINTGLINDTYLIETQRKKYILQKLHKIFKPSVQKDIHKITTLLNDMGLITPLVIKTHTNKLYATLPTGYWRCFTFIPGVCFDKIVNVEQAYSAGKLLGKFHDALSNHNYKFEHKIKNFHNTKKILNELKKLLKNLPNNSKYADILSIGQDIINVYKRIDKKIALLPDRIIHGDPKINNILFTPDAKKALCLLDLDTLGKNKIILDIGDAVRTWCNEATEDDVINTKFNFKIFKQLILGYIETANFITKKELDAIIEGVETILIEQIARFLTDAIKESYYVLQKEKYNTLYEQNKASALAQKKLFEDFQHYKPKITKFIKTLN